jgi:hypothetical protein
MKTNETYRKSHLDADQLNAFIEGVLPEHERQQSLAHLAECQECRKVVFLAQEATAPEPAKATDIAPVRPWFASFWLVGAALACTVLLVAVLHLHHASSRTTPSETATLNKTQTPANNVSQNSPGAVVTQEELNGLPLSPKIPSPPRVPAAPEAKPSPRASAMDATSDETVGQASGSVANLPLVGRSTSPMASQPPAPPIASDALANSAAAGMASAPSNYVAGQEGQLAQNTTSMGGPLSAATMRGRSQAAAPAQASNQQFALQMARETNSANTLSEARGNVTDQSGAVVPGATVTLQQLSGTANGKAVTNASGQFVIASLPSGRYELQITSPGFQTMTRKFDLGAHDLAQLDSKLMVGSTSQTVEVAASTMEVTNAASYAGLVAEGYRKGSPRPLPSKLPVAITLENGGRTLAVDSAGALFVCKKAGARWKAVKQQWPGKIAALTVTPASVDKAKQSDTGSATAASTFQLATESGAVWVSADGIHWNAR